MGRKRPVWTCSQSADPAGSAEIEAEPSGSEPGRLISAAAQKDPRADPADPEAGDGRLLQTVRWVQQNSCQPYKLNVTLCIP